MSGSTLVILIVGFVIAIFFLFVWLLPGHKSTASLQIEQCRLNAEASVRKRQQEADDERVKRVFINHVLGRQVSVEDRTFLNEYLDPKPEGPQNRPLEEDLCFGIQPDTPWERE